MLCAGSLFAVLLGPVSAVESAQAPTAAGYRCEANWTPGGEGVCAGLTLDAQAHRVYVTRIDCVQIIDIESGVLVRTIPGLEGGSGIAVAPEFNCGFAASSGSDAVLTFNLTSLRPQGAPIAVGKEPGAVVYEPFTRRIFVFNGGSNDVSMIDPAASKVVGALRLGGVPGPAAADGRGAVYVILEDKNEVLALDAATNTVAHRWPLAPGAGPTSLALDAIKHRLFVGCRSGQVVVLDAQTGKRLAEPPTGQAVDACAFDPGAGVAFALSGEGTLTVVQEDSAKPGAFRAVETLKTQAGAQAMAVDPKTHAVYVAALVAGATARDKAPEGFVLQKFMRPGKSEP